MSCSMIHTPSAELNITGFESVDPQRKQGFKIEGRTNGKSHSVAVYQNPWF